MEAIAGVILVSAWKAVFGGPTRSEPDSDSASNNSENTGPSSDCNGYDGDGSSSSGGQTTLGDWM